MQLAKFELVINLKAAKALGLSVPTSMQLVADEAMSAIGTKQTFPTRQSMSAFGGKADIRIEATMAVSAHGTEGRTIKPIQG